MFERMKPVNKQTPCPICGRPDWCLVAPDGSAAICPRVQEGSTKQCGCAGWLHVLKSENVQPRRRTRRLTIASGPTSEHIKRFTFDAERYANALTDDMCRAYAEQLSVSPDALRRLRVGWMFQDRFTWPMCNAAGQVIGIRVRTSRGKYCVTDSKTGLFSPRDISDRGPFLICEGNTDCAAGLSLGFETIGRPSCNSGVYMLKTICRGRDAVIVSDRDEKPDGSQPGQEGAKNLARILGIVCPSVKVVLPHQGTKDLRTWLRAGLTHDMLQAEIDLAHQVSFKLEVSRG